MTCWNLPLNPPNPLQTDSSSASTIEELLDWRVRDRVRTVAAGLVLCLHLGVDPPDVWKPSPCARWECWIDPITGNPIRKVGAESSTQEDGNHLTLHLKSNTQQPSSSSNNSAEKIRENIARNLLVQYENWQPRVRYKTLLDPTSDDLRKLCTSLRKSARTERVLIHYNGHGVPRPTRNGELWVFNKQFTQYIPVNVADVVSWTGWPAVWILDCPAAAFLAHALQKVVTSFTAESSHGSSSQNGTGTIFTLATGSLATGGSVNNSGGTNNTNSTTATDTPADPLKLIVFSACDSHETLPFTPSLPADILTSCLTTPLDMAIRWHCYIGGPLLPKSLSIDSALQIPGKLSDRRTPLGELNWIFTAITDTIAWLVLPRDLFRRLYRQDLLIASLSRNYLLAQRILKSLYCTASTYPVLPPTHQHNLWTLWDHALDTLLAQMSEPVSSGASSGVTSSFGTSNTAANPSVNPSVNTTVNSHTHVHISQSTFFPDQLDAFELWLLQHRNIPPTQISGPPDQLPAALQVLLSQNLRPRALKLFAEFCDFGPWACLECLHVGIHPYILKLIVSNNNTAVLSNQVTKSLLHIWTRLMSVDSSCKADLLKDSAFVYFVSAFSVEPKLASKAIVTFALDNPTGHAALLNNEAFVDIMRKLKISVDEEEEIICKLLLLSQFPGISNIEVSEYLFHDSPEIRASAVLASEKSVVSVVKNDPSPLVRLEVLNRTRDESFALDPFDAISQRYKEGNFTSNFAISFISNFTLNSNSKLNENFCKMRVLNQLEVDAWLERGSKLDVQLAVLESPQSITKIFFHPSKSSVLYFLDAEGMLRQWDWQDDPDTIFDELEPINVRASDMFLIGDDSIYTTTENGWIRIYSLEDNELRSAFLCSDTNVKLLETKTGSVLIAGDKKLSLYNPVTQKLQLKDRVSSPSLSLAKTRDLVEIETGFVVGTDQGTLELYSHDLDSLGVHQISKTGIVRLYLANNQLNIVSSDSVIYRFDPLSSCESFVNYHFGLSDTGVTCFAPHPAIPHLIAYGSTDQSIKLCTNGNDREEFVKLQSIRYHDGFLGQRLGSIDGLAWHPERIILGTVTSESFISIYGLNKQE